MSFIFLNTYCETLTFTISLGLDINVHVSLTIVGPSETGNIYNITYNNYKCSFSLVISVIVTVVMFCLVHKWCPWIWLDVLTMKNIRVVINKINIFQIPLCIIIKFLTDKRKRARGCIIQTTYSIFIDNRLYCYHEILKYYRKYYMKCTVICLFSCRNKFGIILGLCFTQIKIKL